MTAGCTVCDSTGRWDGGQMAGIDLIVAAPWIVFGAGLATVCIVLLRSSHASTRKAERSPPIRPRSGRSRWRRGPPPRRPGPVPVARGRAAARPVPAAARPGQRPGRAAYRRARGNDQQPQSTGSKMPPEECSSPAAIARIRPTGARGPRWRTLLEARWQARVREVTELSLAYHGAAASAAGSASGSAAGSASAPGRDLTWPDQRQVEALLRRTVAARRRLADVEEALGRLAAGEFGFCEQCGSAIPARLLAVTPETRYCPHCDARPARADALAWLGPA
jgi:DnaK suppressor protein